VLLGVAALGIVILLRMDLQAEERPAIAQVAPPRQPEGPAVRPVGATSVQDALEKPFSFPFHKPTTLEEVCRHLRLTLNAPVVLDLAALARQELKPDDEVQLELEGVRLKTGLKLLLDQVGLSYHVVPEDNLLIVTDVKGSGDPFDRVLSELKALHRDVHDLQDTVDNLRTDLGLDAEAGPRLRKPTIIEELPAKPNEKPQPSPTNPQPRSRQGL
jgi:hypothetical protein